MNKITSHRATVLIDLSSIYAGFCRAFILCICLCGPFLAFATTYTVSSTADAGANTLRAVVIDSTSSGDTIRFDQSVNGTSIMLSTTIAANKNLVIIGNGPDATIIDGGAGTHRLFDLVGTWVFDNITFRNGGSDQVFGGAIISNTSLTMINCIFHSNTGHAGGAIYTFGTTKIYNSLFYENKTIRNEGLVSIVESTGGAIQHNSGTLSIINSTIANNTAVDGGGGVRSLVTSDVSLVNNIITFNTSILGSQDVQPNYAPISASHNLIGDLSGSGILLGVTNLSGDPMFIDTLANNYRLKSTSQAINSGINFLIPAGITTDLDGNPRIRYGTVDIGAYEGVACIPSDTLYVDVNNTNPSTPADGSTWAAALTDLQEAINISNNCGSPKQIWVAAGTYLPTYKLDFNGNGEEERERTFYITKNVKIYGGFSGSETMLTERDWTSNQTILSGDIDNTPNDSTGNAYHIMVLNGTTANGDITPNDCILDGFTLEKGNANGGFPHERGGAIYQKGDNTGRQSSIGIANCSFLSNHATDRGGAIFNSGVGGGNSSPILMNCTFSYNTANNGAALYNNGNGGTSSPELTNCTFSYNTTLGDGGAIFNLGVSGGNSSPILTNCTFSYNTADLDGGALYNNGEDGTSSPELTNCTFSYNTATFGGDAIRNRFTTDVAIENCIFWENEEAEITEFSSSGTTLNYSLIQGTTCPSGVTCDANTKFNTDPLFVDAANGDLRLQDNSPAINEGNNSATGLTGITTDLDGNPRIALGIVDMGAYEFGGCPDVLLSFSSPDDFGMYEEQYINTNQTITADNKISGQANITYDAKDGVCLDKNFEVGLGATFVAHTDGCMNSQN